MSASRNALIAAYQAAYTAANGYPAPEVNYENGWYSIGSGILKVKWRERQVIAATDRLLARP